MAEGRPRARSSGRSSRTETPTGDGEKNMEAEFSSRPSVSSRTGKGRRLSSKQRITSEAEEVCPTFMAGMRVTIAGPGAPREFQGREAVLVECDDAQNWRMRILDGSGQECTLGADCLELQTTPTHASRPPAIASSREQAPAFVEAGPPLDDRTGFVQDDGPGGLLDEEPATLPRLAGQGGGPGYPSHGSKRSGASAYWQSLHSEAHYSGLRLVLHQVLRSRAIELTILFLILVSFFMTLLDTNAKAANEPTPIYAEFLLVFCVAAITLEFGARLYVERLKALCSFWFWLDLWVIITGILDYIAQAVYDGGGIAVVNFLRISRVLRLVRIVRYLRAFRELMKVVQMLGSCCRSIFWTLVVTAFIMNCWAALAVEVVHPCVQELADLGMWADCERCRRSFSSVLHADLTLFQTVVAGDSWGQLAVPVIEFQPSTAIVFIGATLTLVLGCLNLVVVVLLDTFADARAREDPLGRHSELQYDDIEDKRALFRMFDKIDEDGNGGLSFEELKAGAGKVSEFRHWLRIMGLDSTDVQQLFRMCDLDSNGEIDPDEFMEAFYRIRGNQTKTSTKFVKHLVNKLSEDTGHLERRLQDKLAQVQAEVHGSTDVMQKGLSEGIPKVVDDMTEKVVQQTEETQARNDAAMRQRIESQMESLEATFQQATREALEIALRTAADTTRHLLAAAARKAERAQQAAAVAAAAKPAGGHQLVELGQETAPETVRAEGRPRQLVDDAAPEPEIPPGIENLWFVPPETKSCFWPGHPSGRHLLPTSVWADRQEQRPDCECLPSESSMAEGPPRDQSESSCQSPCESPRDDDAEALCLEVEEEEPAVPEEDPLVPDEDPGLEEGEVEEEYFSPEGLPCPELGTGPTGSPSLPLRSFLPEGFQPRPPRPRKPKPRRGQESKP